MGRITMGLLGWAALAVLGASLAHAQGAQAPAEGEAAGAGAGQATEADADAPAAVPAAASGEAPGGASGAAGATTAGPAGAAEAAAPTGAAHTRPDAGAFTPRSGARPPGADELRRRRVAAERARVRALLARARAEEQKPPPPPPPRVYGDAGAAFALGVSFASVWNTDPGYDFFDDDDVGQRVGAWLSYDVLALQPSLVLAVEAGWEMGTEEDDGLLGEDLNTEIEGHHAHLGVAMRHVLWPWLTPHARVAGGLSFLDVSLQSLGDNVRYEDKAHFEPFASLGLGFVLRTPARTFENRAGQRASLALGVMVEGGYIQAPAAQLTLDGPDGGERAIALRDADLGELDRSGPYIRTSFVIRY